MVTLKLKQLLPGSVPPLWHVVQSIVGNIYPKIKLDHYKAGSSALIGARRTGRQAGNSEVDYIITIPNPGPGNEFNSKGQSVKGGVRGRDRRQQQNAIALDDGIELMDAE